ncbi:MAG: dihydrolipoyl dehydrogenase [Geminicoccaceae bacterium]|nr:dihydrolipoyl dehydrogenase [Geminicoccaceae bacterium]
MASYDVIIIGAGPGGYVCAIRCAQLGLKTACVEARETLGGTCLNVGCIPSKALLHSSHLYETAAHKFAEHGLNAGGVTVDVAKMRARKDGVVKSLTDGIKFLFKKNKVEYVEGTGTIKGKGEVEAALTAGGSRTLKAKAIVIATGSESMPLKGVEVDEKRVVSSTGILDLEKVPEHLVVIGGGYIGLEMGTVWLRLGAKVTVVEFLERITPGMDLEVSKQFQRILQKQGMTFRLGTKVTGVDASGERLKVGVEPAKGGDAGTIEADVVLLAIGRRAYTQGLGLENAGVKLDERGRVEVDERFATSVEGVYAIGDVIRGPMLAHKAEEEGSNLAEYLAGQKPHLDYDIIPGVVYTAPEVAAIGKTEEQLKEAGVGYKVGKFPFSANSRARSTGDSDGFVKLLCDAKTDRVLGAHIIGPEAGVLIAEVALAMEYGASAEDIARTCHAHPTLEEAVKEAALAAYFKPIHI